MHLDRWQKAGLFGIAVGLGLIVLGLVTCLLAPWACRQVNSLGAKIVAPLDTVYLPFRRILADMLGAERIALDLTAYPSGVFPLLVTLDVVALALYWFILGVSADRLVRLVKQVATRNSHARM